MATDILPPSPDVPSRSERRRPEDPETAVRRLRAESTLREAPCEPVSGLLERGYFLGRLRHALQREPARPVAVVVLDLHAFRAYNRERGFEKGDALLRATGDAVRGAVRASDPASRLGGDEFAVLLDDVRPTDALRIAGRLCKAVASLDGAAAPSAGVAVRTSASDRAEDLLHAAFRGLDRSRTLGVGPQTGSAGERSLTLDELEVALRRTVDRVEFTTHYQPSVAAKAGCVAGFEVLLWRRSTERRAV